MERVRAEAVAPERDAVVPVHVAVREARLGDGEGLRRRVGHHGRETVHRQRHGRLDELAGAGGRADSGTRVSGSVLVVEVSLSINLASLTIEQVSIGYLVLKILRCKGRY